MDIQNKTKEELIIELQELKQENSDLKALIENRSAELITANKEYILQNEDISVPSLLRQKAEESLQKQRVVRGPVALEDAQLKFCPPRRIEL
jgi:hypothetical protein